MEMLLLWVNGLLVFFPLLTVFGPLFGCCNSRSGLDLGFLVLFFNAGGGRSSVEAWYTTALDIEEVLSGVADSDVHLFVADVVKSCDTVDRGVLDKCRVVCCFRVRFAMLTSSTIRMFGFGSNSRAADGGQRDGRITTLGSPDCRTGYRRAQDILLLVSFSGLSP